MTVENERPRAITKVLSRNDTGETGGHQAGILIPKNPTILAFFPRLDSSIKNPRVRILFSDPLRSQWRFSFIYYNNNFFGGTRNEYRLTSMTSFMRSHNLKAGDRIVLLRNDDEVYSLSYERERPNARPSVVRDQRGEYKVDFGPDEERPGLLRLGSSWKIIDF